MKHNQILITTNDSQRLTDLTGLASLMMTSSGIASRLYEKFRLAKMLSREVISEKVITMNSRVLVKGIKQDGRTEITVAYAPDASPREGKISVFSPAGLALSGRQVGDQASGHPPSGIERFEITKIICRPEPVGHYHLQVAMTLL